MRVPLDFSWPKDMIWKGYINPYRHQDCGVCKGTGESEGARLFSAQWFGNAPFDPVAYGAEPLDAEHPKILEKARRNVGWSQYRGFPKTREAEFRAEARRLHKLFSRSWEHNLIQADVDALVAAGRLYDFTRQPLTPEQAQDCHESGWTREPNGYRPTAAEVNAWSLDGIGHDCQNQNICVQARCLREGVALECSFCQGAARIFQSPEIEALYRGWEPFEPPAGEGYQLWENVTEGSPQSPVFETLDELCAWCAGNADTFAGHTATAAEWKHMLERGLVAHVEVIGGRTCLFT